MMPFQFSENSAAKLATCDPRLQVLLNWAIRVSPVDFAVISGYRGEAYQNELQEEGKSQLRYPNSKHNKQPSLAVDIVPYVNNAPDFERIELFWTVYGVIHALSEQMGVDIAWGGLWSFKDYGHFELV